ncbi:hypothetical protein J6590_030436 [Homalodisca vitripennis]|nr:hypothetical protein J6590_030436 [Homalodisca vitripennis]
MVSRFTSRALVVISEEDVSKARMSYWPRDKEIANKHDHNGSCLIFMDTHQLIGQEQNTLDHLATGERLEARDESPHPSCTQWKLLSSTWESLVRVAGSGPSIHLHTSQSGHFGFSMSYPPNLVTNTNDLFESPLKQRARAGSRSVARIEWSPPPMRSEVTSLSADPYSRHPPSG